MLLSSVDVALAKGKKKKARKVQRTEMYEEIDNFDFLYSNDYDVNMSFASTDDILSQATSFIGTRYRLGSKGPYAFDCSGFTSYVYGQNNISIGCSSRDQYARNIPIRTEEMQPGDLVLHQSSLRTGCRTCGYHHGLQPHRQLLHVHPCQQQGRREDQPLHRR